MARSTISTTAAHPIRPLIEDLAKQLVDRLYGQQGPAWGTKLTEIEDVVLAVRQVLSEKMLDEALSRQASTAETRPDPWRCCPTCGREVEPAEPDPRIVATRAGEAQWLEPSTHCRKCRRSFFPSEQKSGD